MGLVIGIDEAGLGPILGPLVVSGAAFRISDEHQTTCLWNLLRESCTNRVSASGRRLVVADSKRLYRPPGSIKLLERAALVMLGVAGQRPPTFRRLLETVCRGAVPALRDYPWYTGPDFPLPACAETGDLGTRIHAVRRDCDRQGISLTALSCEPLTEGQFNRRIHSGENKAEVVAALALRVAGRLLADAGGGDRVRIHVDRLGGRVHYAEVLARSFPEADVAVVAESPDRSVYRLTRRWRTCDVEFATRSERRHFAVALASVMSKYVRESYMSLFNRYWSEQAADLAPTAGYYTDAQRWLRQAEPHIRRLKVDRALLVRQR